MIHPYERYILLLPAARIAERAASSVVAATRAPATRAFFRSFREAVGRANVSVGGVSVSLGQERERPAARIREGWIEAPRLTDARDVLRCGNERTDR
jgi:hypothetical protein